MLRRVFLVAVPLLCMCTSVALAEEKKVIVRFREAPALTDHEKHEKVYRTGGKVRRRHPFIHAVAAQLPEEAIARLSRDPDVISIEEDRIIHVDEPLPVEHAPSAEYLESWGVRRIGADEAARNGINGAGVKVAILDSGVDYNHPDLKDNYRGGYNFAYDNDDPFDDTRVGHGTHVAGIIAARDNGTGVVGVAPDASIYAVKVLNGGMMGSTSDIVAGIEWAILNSMDVINMSFGIPSSPQNYSEAVDAACRKAYEAGIILVAAAGNSRSPEVDYPAAFDSVIAVAATMQDDTPYTLSNRGQKVELAAPGAGIKSTVPGGGYATLSGTSQAAPHVAGAAALAISARSSAGKSNGNDKVRRRLDSAAIDLGDRGRDGTFGYGLVQAPAHRLGRKSTARPGRGAFGKRQHHLSEGEKTRGADHVRAGTRDMKGVGE